MLIIIMIYLKVKLSQTRIKLEELSSLLDDEYIFYITKKINLIF
jgi:hypothetical protein